MTEIKIDPRQYFKLFLFEPEYFARLIEEHGPKFTATLGGQRVHHLATPQAIKHIFSDNQPNFQRTLKITGRLKYIFGNYSLATTTDHDLWKADRDILSTFFTKAKLNSYTSIMINQISKELDKISEYVNSHKPIALNDFYPRLTLRIIIETLFAGVQVPFDTLTISKTSSELSLLNTPPFYYSKVKFLNVIPLPLYFRYKKLKREFTDIIYQIIENSFQQNDIENNFIMHLATAYGFDQYDKLTPKNAGAFIFTSSNFHCCWS